MSMPGYTKHVVAFTISGGWGHARPMVAFLCRLVQRAPVLVTFIVSVVIEDKTRNEVDRFLTGEHADKKEQFRLVFIPAATPVRMQEMKENFENAYKPILADITTRAPDVMVCDTIAHCVLQSTRAMSPATRIVGWCGYGAIAILTLAQMFEKDIEKHWELIERREKEEGVLPRAVANEIALNATSGKTLDVADLPPMADYELFPQPPVFMPWDVHFHSVRSVPTCEAIIAPSCRSIEPKTCDALAARLAPNHYFAVGPLFPPAEEAMSKAGVAEIAQSDEGAEIVRFMDRMLEERGAKSVLYISFGSTFSTFIGIEKEVMWAWFDVVADMGIPVIIAYHKMSEPLPAELKAKFDAGGLTLISTWTPQQYVLTHPATGWFLTHNGFGGTNEALAAGVPTISWPICADQPLYALLVSRVHKTGYELNEVRRGFGRRPRQSNGWAPSSDVFDINAPYNVVWTPGNEDKVSEETIQKVREEVRRVLGWAFFDEAERREKEANAARVKAMVESAWAEREGEEQGVAVRDMQRFIEVFLS
ncbi:UDP-Glycosyltransferase/glycogen phosphorylase [Schizophyllum commune Tattone D]|nr:UDP-Glycosyltransferase/glycogen phosphorylase [Schizophyllum commune Tattone D]